jgi:hypothetical protein
MDRGQGFQGRCRHALPQRQAAQKGETPMKTLIIAVAVLGLGSFAFGDSIVPTTFNTICGPGRTGGFDCYASSSQKGSRFGFALIDEPGRKAGPGYRYIYYHSPTYGHMLDTITSQTINGNMVSGTFTGYDDVYATCGNKICRIDYQVSGTYSLVLNASGQTSIVHFNFAKTGPGVNTGVVPEPPSFWFALTGIVGIGALKLRRRAI